MISDRVHRLVITVVSLVVWLALIIAGSARPSVAQTQKNDVVITVSTKDLSSSPVWLAQRFGFFKKEGIESKSSSCDRIFKLRVSYREMPTLPVA